LRGGVRGGFIRSSPSVVWLYPKIFSGSGRSASDPILIFKSLGDHVSPANTVAMVVFGAIPTLSDRFGSMRSFFPGAANRNGEGLGKYDWPDLLPRCQIYNYRYPGNHNLMSD
jgi:hypothetical protein